MDRMEALKSALFGLMMAFGMIRMVRTFYKRRQGELPMPSRLTEKDVRRLVRKGDRPRAIRAWRDLTGDDLRKARAAIDRIEAELDGEGPAETTDPAEPTSPL
jgi:hypothetical protein